MIAFTGIVFSISLLVAQFWNTAYSFRLTQWLRQTPLTAHAFGVFSATFVYALAALLVLGRHPGLPTRAHRGWRPLALLLASVLVFLLLLYGTLRQMNLSYVLVLVGDRGREVIDGIYGEPGGSGGTRHQAMSWRSDGVRAGSSTAARPRSSSRSTSRASSRSRPPRKRASTSRSASGTPCPTAPSSPASLAARSRESVRRAFMLGDERTMEQDPKLALRLLVDVAIKALSPAVNDPTTAVQALDQIEDLLRRMGQRTLDLGRLSAVRGFTRVTYPAPTWDDLLALGTDEIRMFGSDSLQVVRRLRLLLENLAETITPDRRAAVHDRLERLDAAIERGSRRRIVRTRTSRPARARALPPGGARPSGRA